MIFIFAEILSLTVVFYPQFRPYLVPPAESRPEITVLYRKSTREEREAIKPNDEDLKKYADFLKEPDTGLTKLAADLGCNDNAKILVASSDCLKYTMPGAGASYSFRVNDYRIQTLADLAFINNSFQATGDLIHGILTKIGDIPLEKVDLQTKGLKFLVDFVPVTDYDEARKIDRKFVNGIVNEDFVYRRGLNALENTTYVLRSVAYNGVYSRIVNGFSYNEFIFDKRKDIIVAFRIVRKDPAGSVTILWKKLAEKDSPKIKQKKEKLS